MLPRGSQLKQLPIEIRNPSKRKHGNVNSFEKLLYSVRVLTNSADTLIDARAIDAFTFPVRG